MTPVDLDERVHVVELEVRVEYGHEATGYRFACLSCGGRGPTAPDRHAAFVEAALHAKAHGRWAVGVDRVVEAVDW